MQKASKRFKIYYVASGFGLTKDADILRKNITALGYGCEISQLKPGNLRYGFFYKFFIDLLSTFNFVFLYKKIQRLFVSKPHVIALHLEKVFPEKLFLNEVHVLIPNQEWFDVRSITHLQSFEAVWCKSKIAANAFRELKPGTEYIGFCSEIGEESLSAPKEKSHFFSRIGRSLYRGGELLIDVWSRHPEWPTLKIVMHSDRRPAFCPANVECLDTITDPNVFIKLSSSSQFHIYLSETEGFGHTIVEALGYGAIVLVTDGPPMNEITHSACALMVEAKYAGHKMLATRFAAVPLALERAVEQALLMSDQEIEQRRLAAMEQYQRLQKEFQDNLARVIDAI